MAKTKTPFLSFGSRGTVGGVLTSQKRGRETIIRKTPVPRDPYSLNQAYQRWDYRDYAHLWTLESEADKQTYRSRASRYHITGFSLWMRERLNELTNLEGRWHLDENSGASAFDSSKNTNHGTIIGASPVSGVISGAYYFDGLNDLINCGNDPSLRPPELSVESFIITPDPLTWQAHTWEKSYLSRYDTGLNKRVWTLGLTNQHGAADWMDQLNIFLGDPADGTVEYGGYYNFRLSGNTRYHVSFTFSGGTLIVYLNGQPVTLTTFLGAVPASLYLTDVDLIQGCRLNNGALISPLEHTQDEVRLYSAVLPQTLIERHSERRYP